MPKSPKRKHYVKTVSEIIEAALSPRVSRRRRKFEPQNPQTLATRITAVMGRKTMTTDQVIAALDAAGIKINSNHLRRYINQTLITATTSAKGPDRVPLRYPVGGLVKVPVFTAAAWGQYRVATPAERQQAAREMLSKHAFPAGSALRRNHVPEAEGPVTTKTLPMSLPAVQDEIWGPNRRHEVV